MAVILRQTISLVVWHQPLLIFFATYNGVGEFQSVTAIGGLYGTQISTVSRYMLQLTSL